MNKLNVFVGKKKAGELYQESNGYRFLYEANYSGPPVFLNLPVKAKEKQWTTFPPSFDGLLPEGVLLDQLLAKHKIDRNDKWFQLEVVGKDLTGFLTISKSEELEISDRSLYTGPAVSEKQITLPKGTVLPYSTQEITSFHATRKIRMSLSGVQPKVSAVFSPEQKNFRIAEQNGNFILKPSPQAFPNAAELEAFTMNLAKLAGIEVPDCGLINARDGLPVYWIRRFDRHGENHSQRLRCEDFCQLLEVPTTWKYSGNIETMVRAIRDYCSNYRLQLANFYRRFLFCWLTGNGDMHLKNWSLVETRNIISLAPAYDYLNTAILINDEEESALYLDDRKSDFNRDDLIDYLGIELCELSRKMCESTLETFRKLPLEVAIRDSALSPEHQAQYLEIYRERLNRIASA